jgi:5-methylcytosine-specific restriction endonuclease McrA
MTQKRFDDFLATSGECRECIIKSTRKRQKTLSIEEAKIIFENSGCDLLENKYIDCDTPMKYKCKCGNIGYKKTRHVNPKLGVQCFECSLHYGEKHPQWNPDRESVKLRKYVHDKCRAAVKYCIREFGKRKSRPTREYVGFSDYDLMEHLKKFPNWEQLKDTNWEMDHIFPVQAFIEYKIYDIKLINSLDNLQPLTRQENLKKSDRYDKSQFVKWLKSKGISATLTS